MREEGRSGVGGGGGGAEGVKFLFSKLVKKGGGRWGGGEDRTERGRGIKKFELFG